MNKQKLFKRCAS